MITCAELQYLFEYKNNSLFWKNPPKSQQKLFGKKAGHIRKDGYINIKIKGKDYLAHRLIFLMHNGFLPSEVDHKTDKSNKIENLRASTKTQNQHNAKTRIDNTSGCKGVTWHKVVKKWYVQIQINGKRQYLGVYNDLELADLVAHEARDKYHKDFARHK